MTVLVQSREGGSLGCLSAAMFHQVTLGSEIPPVVMSEHTGSDQCLDSPNESVGALLLTQGRQVGPSEGTRVVHSPEGEQALTICDKFDTCQSWQHQRKGTEPMPCRIMVNAKLCD